MRVFSVVMGLMCFALMMMAAGKIILTADYSPINLAVLGLTFGMLGSLSGKDRKKEPQVSES